MLVAVTGILAALLAASARRPPAPPARPRRGGGPPDVRAAVPADVACRELVALVTDYLDGVLPARLARAGLDRHLAVCDGCTTYLQQIRATIDALARARP